MLAAWNRGNRPILPSPTVRRRLPLAQFARLFAASALSAAVIAPLGCDSPSSVADKDVRSKTEAVDLPAGKPADDPAIVSGVSSTLTGGKDPTKLTDAEKKELATTTNALQTLGKRDLFDAQSKTSWRNKEGELNLQQRRAIADNMRRVREADRNNLRTALQAATQPANATSETMVDPMLRLTQVDQASGEAAGFAAAEKSNIAGDVAAEIGALLSYIRRNNESIALLKTQDPKNALAALDAMEQKIKGKETAPMALRPGPNDPAPPEGEWTFVGTKTAADTVVAKALSESQLQATIDELTKQRDAAAAAKKAADEKAAALLAEARTFAAKAESEVKEEALADAIKAADIKVEAAAQQREADKQHQIVTERDQDLAVIKTRQPMNVAAKALVDAERKAVAARWAQVELQIAELEKENKRVLGTLVDPKNAPPRVTVQFLPTTGAKTQPATPLNARKLLMDDSIVGLKLAQMRVALAAAEAERVKAEAFYRQALVDNATARTTAAAAREAIDARKKAAHAEVSGDLNNPWSLRLDLLDQTQFDFRDAVLQERLGRLAGERLVDLLVAADVRERAGGVLSAPDLESVEFHKLPTRTGNEAGTIFKTATEAYEASDAAVRKIGVASVWPTPGAAAGATATPAEAPAAADTSSSGSGGAGTANPAEGEPMAISIKRAARALHANMSYSMAGLQALMNGQKAADTYIGYAVTETVNYVTDEKALPRGTPIRIQLDDKVRSAMTAAGIPAPVMPTAQTQPTTAPSTTQPTTPEGTPPGETAPTLPAAAIAAAPAEWVEQTIPGSTATIRVPADWKVAPPPNAMVKLAMVAGAGDGTNLGIGFAPFPPGTSFKVLMPQVVKLLPQMLPGAKVLSTGVRDVGGTETGEAVIEVGEPATMKMLQIYVKSGANGYVLTFGGPAAAYDTNEPLFRQIAATIKLPEAPVTPPTTPPVTPPEGTTPPAPPPATAPADGTAPPATPPAPTPEGTTPAPPPAPTPAPPPAEGGTPPPTPSPAPPPAEGAPPAPPPAPTPPAPPPAA
jgi:hypothetical protein